MKNMLTFITPASLLCLSKVPKTVDYFSVPVLMISTIFMSSRCLVCSLMSFSYVLRVGSLCDSDLWVLNVLNIVGNK